jgi:hypothetical protein
LSPYFGDARSVFFGTALKRESGENPEQTRCCKLRQQSLNDARSTVPEKGGKEVSKREQVRRPARIHGCKAFEE